MASELEESWGEEQFQRACSPLLVRSEVAAGQEVPSMLAGGEAVASNERVYLQ
jgi:hypothetical protein